MSQPIPDYTEREQQNDAEHRNALWPDRCQRYTRRLDDLQAGRLEAQVLGVRL